MDAIREFIARIRASGVKLRGTVRTVAMGREREFCAWNVGNDTFVFERGISGHLAEHPSVLVVAKAALRWDVPGRILTMTVGNHSVAALPLLDGRFWGFSRLQGSERSEALLHSVVCANVVASRLELSQREVCTPLLVETDSWLRLTTGFTLSDVVMSERNDATLDYFRRLGQDWRVKPLAWSENEMKTALSAARKRIATKLTYYHAAKGVHFLTFPEFRRFVAFGETSPDEFKRGLHELVGVYEGNTCSFARMPKFRGHHEIEFFGLRRGDSVNRLVSAIENLMEAVQLGRIDDAGLCARSREIVALYESLLTRPSLADESSRDFVETLYMYITGEIYAVVGEGSTPAFDDRRTALPGATFEDGTFHLHPGADMRTDILLRNLIGLMSKDEVVEYANIYELRAEDDRDAPLGSGATREVVYKTNRSPLEASLVEKRLSRSSYGYGSYMLARIGALRALGVTLSEYYQLLKRRPEEGRRECDHYIRRRCEGEPMGSIPASWFCTVEDTSVEEKDVVLALAVLMGDAAAQNMAMKKFDPVTSSPLYGVGKEIYEFEYDIGRERVMPKRVSTCSIRGSFGWPDLSCTEENLAALTSFYLGHYAHALKDYCRRHKTDWGEVAERFMNGFEHRTNAMEWQFSVMRDKFEAFDPPLPVRWGFKRKWDFLLWSLERQARRLPTLRKVFIEKVQAAVK